MLFDEAMTAGQVLALYHGACVAGQVCNRGRPGCTEGQKMLSCMESAEHTSGLQIGDQVEHHWDSMLPDFCHSTPTVGSFGAVTNADPPDPMLARGTVCGFDGSLVLIHWDMVMNTAPSCGAEQVTDWCGSDGTWCRNGNPFWTRLRDGAPRDNSWLASYLGDAADTSAQGGMGHTTLCGVSPTKAELKAALPPFALEKITCSHYGGDVASGGGQDVMSGDCQPDPNWTPPILGGRTRPGGGHRRQMGSEEAAPEPSPVGPPAFMMEDTESSRRGLQTMGIDQRAGAKAAHKNHLGLQDFDTDTCTMDTIAALAEAVDADCCYQNGVYKCSSDSQVPESCSYTCGVVMVPFMNGCRDLITNLFPRELTGLTTLYEQCLNADARVLANAYNHRECCTSANCGGCGTQDSCSAVAGNTCQWGPAAQVGRVVDTRCNCVGSVSRTIIASGIWVVFFQECQR